MGAILLAVHAANERFAELGWAFFKEVTAGHEGLYEAVEALATRDPGEPAWVPTALGLVLYALAIACSSRLAYHARRYRQQLGSEAGAKETPRWLARGAT